MKNNGNFADDGWYESENIRLSSFGTPNKWIKEGLIWKLKSI